MATITTTIVPNAVRTPFINPYGQPDVWNTIIPRSEIVFSSIDFVIDLSGVGDDQLLVVNNDLPAGFAYVLLEHSVVVEGVDADEWAANGHCSLADSSVDASASWKKCLQAPSLISRTTLTNFTRCYKPEGSSKIVIPKPGLVGRLQIQTQNFNTNKVAGVGTTYARFLLFDVNQAQFNAIHTPVPVR